MDYWKSECGEGVCGIVVLNELEAIDVRGSKGLE